MPSREILLCESIIAAIDGGTYTETVAAAQVQIDEIIDLAELPNVDAVDGLAVHVAPGRLIIEAAVARSGPAAHDYTSLVIVRAKCDPIDQLQVRRLLLAAEEIAAEIPKAATAEAWPLLQILREPIFIGEHLRELNQFTAPIEARYRAFK